MPWDMNSMIAAAAPNRITARNSGWADIRPVLVAVEAEAQRIANRIPAKGQRQFECFVTDGIFGEDS